MKNAGRKRIAKLIWALLAVWMAFSLPGCVWRAGPGAGGSDASGAGSVPLSGSEKSPENPGVRDGEKNPRSPGSGYRLATQKDYPYGSGPSAFGLYPEAGGRAHGGFSAGGPEEDLYVFDLANQNVKVLRKTDAALLKVVELPREAARADGADLGVDENGVIYVLAIGADRTVRVVAFNDAGKALSVYSVPEGAAEKPPVYGRDKLVRTQEGRVVLWLPEKGRLYSFRDGRFMERRYRIEIKGGKVLEVSRLEGSVAVWTGRYESERPILSADFLGEDALGNAWVQVEEREGKSVRLGALRFSKEGKLLDSLFFPESDCRWHAPRLLNVGRDGTVYQVVPAEKFLKVRVWSPE